MNSSSTLTEMEFLILRHTIGENEGRKEDRNFFNLGKNDGDNFITIKDLEKRGLMERVNRKGTHENEQYCATPLGINSFWLNKEFYTNS